MNLKADWFKLLLAPVVLLLALLTLPIYDISLIPGIDPPLQWVFDHFYTSGFENARHLHFPHGPLAFFMYPLSNSLPLVVAVTIVLKLLIAHLMVYVQTSKNWKEWFLTLILIYVVFIVSQFNQLLIVAVLLSYIQHSRSERWVYLFMGIFITAFSIYVKSYVGIITGVISASYFIHLGVSRRSVIEALLPGLYLVLLYFLGWLIIFNTADGFINYFVGIIQLAGDNSSAASYYPWNNWLALTLFILLICSLPFVNRSTENYVATIMILPAFFAGWKHGMAREDLSHYHGLFSLIILFLVVLLIGSKQKRMLNLIIGAVSVFLLNLNGQQLDNYQKPVYQTASFERIFQFRNSNVKNVISHHEVSADTRAMIGNHSVDIYPWDYSIIAANGFNWKPRPVLHSYAAYTKWLDGKNKEHFEKDAPEFIIWELNKITTDYNGGNMESIDNRYLLNNEPTTLKTLLLSYRGVKRESHFLILKKREQPLTFKTKTSLSGSAKMGEWISLPSHGNRSLLQFKPVLSKSFLQGLKSFFYKDEQYWILLKTDLGSIYKYRIVPKIASNGIWVNPLIIHHDAEDLIVTEVAIVSSGEDLVPADFNYTWEETTLSDENAIDQFFARKETYFKTWPFYTYEQNYSDVYPEWSSSTTITKELRESVQEYSSTLSVSLDSIPFREFTVRSSLDLWSHTDELQEVQLVLTVEGPNKKYTSSEHIKFQMLDTQEKNVIVNSLQVDSLEEGSILKVFLFNPKKLTLEIDNFKVELLNP